MAPRPKGIADDILKKIISEVVQAAKGVVPDVVKAATKTVDAAPSVRTVAAAAVESSSVAKKLADLRAAKVAGSVDDATYLDGLLDIRAAKGSLTKEERRTINIAQNKAIQDSKKTGGALADERMKANLADKKVKSDKSKKEMKIYSDIKFTGKEQYDIAASALRSEFDSTMSIVDRNTRLSAGFIEGYEKEGQKIVNAGITELGNARKAGMKVTSPEYGELVRQYKQKLAKWQDQQTIADKVAGSRNQGLETRLGNLSKMTDQEVIDAGVRQSLWDDDISMAEIRRVRKMNQKEFAVWRAENLRDAKKVSKPTGKPFPEGDGGDKPFPVSKSAAELAEQRMAKLAKKAGISLDDYKKIKAAEKAQQMKAQDKMNVPDVDSQDVLRGGESPFKIVDKKVLKVDGKDTFVEATAKERAAALKRTDVLRKKDAKVAKARQVKDAKYDKSLAAAAKKNNTQSPAAKAALVQIEKDYARGVITEERYLTLKQGTQRLKGAAVTDAEMAAVAKRSAAASKKVAELRLAAEKKAASKKISSTPKRESRNWVRDKSGKLVLAKK